MCLLVAGVSVPDVVDDKFEDPLWVVGLVKGVSEPDIEMKSDTLRSPRAGRSPEGFPSCCALKASVACFMSVEEDSERCSMTSDTLRFLSMGFFRPKELLRDIWLAGGVAFE